MNFQKSKYFSRVIAAIVFVVSAPFVSANEMNGNKFVSWATGYTDQPTYSIQWNKSPAWNKAFDENVSAEDRYQIAGIKDLIKGAGSDKGGDKNNKLYIDLNNMFFASYSDSNPAYNAGNEIQLAGLKSLIQGAGSSTKNTGVVISDGVIPVAGSWALPAMMYQHDLDFPVVELN